MSFLHWGEINHFGKIAWQGAAECGKLCPLSAPYLQPGSPPNRLKVRGIGRLTSNQLFIPFMDGKERGNTGRFKSPFGTNLVRYVD